MAQATRDPGREAHWRRVLARWKCSGLSVRAFCQAEGVSVPSFYGRRRKLDQADRENPAFLPVHVVTEEAKEPTTRGIEIVLANGRCLRIGSGFESSEKPRHSVS